MEPNCTLCRIQACSVEPGTKAYPAFCPMARGNTQGNEALVHAREAYDDAETRRLALAAAQTEADRYPLEPRVEEVMSFARRIGANHLGIACCAGLLHEARLFQEIVEGHGLQASSVCCKVGSIPKEVVGITDAEKVHPGQYEALCNPIGQAMLLNAAGTDLNVLVGLCVGHDSLFIRHSEALVTVLIAKDRVTGHNPAAVLYTSHSYYRRVKA